MTYENRLAGGLRVKEIRSHDAVASSADVVRTYDYVDSADPAKSSGKLLFKTNYGVGQSFYDGTYLVNYLYFSAASIVPMSSFDGYHFGYQRVVENHNGNGRRVFTFYTEEPSNVTPTAYPAPPAPAYVRRGNVATGLTANAAGQTLASSTNSYQNDAYQGTSILMYKALWINFCQEKRTVPRNYVQALTTYTAVSGSALTQRGTVRHFDGLGRLVQESAVKRHPGKGANDQTFSTVDVLTHYEYDNQGRLIKASVPFASPTGSQDGSYQTPPPGLFFTLTSYEASPLNRAVSVTPPNGYATLTAYGTNSATVTVPGAGLSYAAGSLFETKVTDPDNRVAFTYTDKRGRLILTRSTNTANTSPAETYRRYDDKDRLTMVIPPLATASSSELIYTYEYSGDDLVLKKKVPGAAVVNMRYNSRDLPVFTQDGNLLAAGKSLAVQYDAYGRPVKSGFVAGFPTNPEAFTFSETLTETFYDGQGGGITTDINLATYPQYRGRIRCSKAKALDATGPFLNSTFTYDAYGRLTNTAGNNYLNTGSNTAESVAYTYDWADDKLTENRTHTPGAGAATGAQTINYQWQYDHMGRPTNYLLTLNGANTHLAEYNYDQRDQLIERNLHYNSVGGVWGWLQSVDYVYNDQGWLLRINASAHVGAASAFPTGCSPGLPAPGSPARVKFPEDNDLFYLELRYEQLFSSGSGGITGLSGTAQKSGNISQLAWRTRGRERQAYTFSYDHLSRLTSAAYFDVNGAGTASASNRYNEGTITYDLRGNITALQRNGYYSSTCGYGQIDNLTYTYASGTNRISSIADNALASQKMHGFNPGAGGAGYTYDANGNLKSDSYKGISNIAYNHLNLPNVITYSSGNSIEIVYDAAGGKLRKIVRVGATVQYELDYAGGVEYRKVGAGSKRIEAIYHTEGRYFNLNVEVNNTLNWRKEFAIRDHLGNTRLMFTDKNGNGIVDVTNSASTNDIVQENHFYPFGLGFEGPWLMNDAARDNAYRYNNKELNEDFGLDWYAYGARYYDPAVGRFTGVDPIADQFAWVTPYNYAENEPVGSIDLHGLQRLIVNNGYRLSAAPEWQRNTATIGAGIRYPSAALKVGEVKYGSTNISSVAGRIARHAASDNNLSTGIGTERNALRHGIWSAMINQAFGSEAAETLTNAHEGIGVLESASVRMSEEFEGDMMLADDIVDFLNNEIGRSITEEGGDLSPIQIAEQVLEVFKNKGLFTATKDKDGNVSISRTKITEEQYNTALSRLRKLNKNGFSPEEQKELEHEK